MELTIELRQEERVYTDEGKPMIAVHLAPILFTLEERKELQKHLEGHIIRVKKLSS